MKALIGSPCQILLALLIFGLSCNRIKPTPPVRTTSTTVLEQPVSVLTLPISFDLGKLEVILNEKLRGTFLRKKIKTNHNDSLDFSLTSLNPVTLAWEAPNLRTTADLRVSGHYIKKVLGISIQNKSAIEFEVKIHLKTELGFEDDWSIRPKTVIEKIDWKKDPELDLGLIVLNFRGMVEKSLDDNQDGLTKVLDNFIRQEVDTRRVIGNIWNKIQQPVRIKKDDPGIWLLVEADSLKARWTRSPNRQIIVQAQVTGKVRTILEGEELQPAIRDLPIFSFRAGTPDSLYANVLCVLPFELGNRYLRKQMVGTTFDTAGYSAEIRSIEVYGTNDGLAVKVGVGGDAKGFLYFRGTPIIDPYTKSCRIKDFDFDVDTENSILSTANWLLHSSLKNKIESQLVFDLKPYVDMLPTLIEKGIDNGRLGERLEISIQSWEVTPVSSAITSRDVQMIVRVTGLAGIELKKIGNDTSEAKVRATNF